MLSPLPKKIQNIIIAPNFKRLGVSCCEEATLSFRHEDSDYSRCSTPYDSPNELFRNEHRYSGVFRTESVLLMASKPYLSVFGAIVN